MKYENKKFVYETPKEISVYGTVKHLFNCIRYSFYSLFISIFSKTVRITEKKYKVAICAIFKNEAPYIKEWIIFHKLVGIEHFYMYNNNSNDGFLEILEEYINEGLVTLIDWPGEQQQMAVYHDCINRFKGDAKWIGFIDLDEFVVPKATDNVYELLHNFERRAGSVKLYWRLYGSSGKIERDISTPIIEDFVVCWPKLDAVGKCFYNTAYDVNLDSKLNGCLHHSMWTLLHGVSIPPLNIEGRPCVGHINVISGNKEIDMQINHYFTKSFLEYEERRKNGDVFYKVISRDEKYFYAHDRRCTSVDYSAYRYLVRLKRLLNGEKIEM